MPSLRLRSDYFAIATIAFAEIVRYTFQNAEFAGGNQGMLGYDQEWRASPAGSPTGSPPRTGDKTQLPIFLAVWIAFLLCLSDLRRCRRHPGAAS